MPKLNEIITKLNQNKFLVWILILAVTLIWGYAWVHMKASLVYMGPFTFSALRFSLGALVLLLIVLILKLGLPPKKYWKHILVVGLLQTTVVYLFVMYGLRFVDAGKSSVLLYSMPMWSSLLAIIYLGEKINIAKLIGLFMGLIGLLTILGWDVWIGQSLEVLFGELLMIIAAFSWAVSNIYFRRTIQHLPKIQTNAFQMLFGSIGIIIAALFMEWGEPIILNAQSIYYVLFTGVLASALGFSLWFIILSMIDMVTATISSLLVPVFGLFFSSLILGERLSIGVIVGSSLILLGIVVAQIKKKEARLKDR